MRYFLQIPINKQDTNFISTNSSSDKFLITTIVIGMPKNLHVGTFSSDFEHFFLVKNNFVSFKEQIWLPNKKCYGKNKLYFDQEEMVKMA